MELQLKLEGGVCDINSVYDMVVIFETNSYDTFNPTRKVIFESQGKNLTIKAKSVRKLLMHLLDTFPTRNVQT